MRKEEGGVEESGREAYKKVEAGGGSVWLFWPLGVWNGAELVN